METIEQILKKYDTDKVRDHSYGEGYNAVFERFNRNDTLNILEIGIQRGGSLLAWKEYFPNSVVTGVDIMDQVEHKDPNIRYITSDVKKWETNEKFDLIIDDGSHYLADVIWVIDNYVEKLTENGVIVIEDVQKPDVWTPAVLNVLSCFKMSHKDFKGRLALGYYDMRNINGRYDDFLIIIAKDHGGNDLEYSV